MAQDTEADDARARITAANQHNSPLLRLPAELRNLIYDYALGGLTLCFMAKLRWSNKERGYLNEPRLLRPLHVSFTLLRTCTQIYAETAILPYSLNLFYFSYFTTAKTLLGSIFTWQVKAIKHLGLNCEVFSTASEEDRDMFSLLRQCEGLSELNVLYYGEPANSYGKRWTDIGEAHLVKTVRLLQETMPNLKVWLVKDKRLPNSITEY